MARNRLAPILRSVRVLTSAQNNGATYAKEGRAVFSYSSGEKKTLGRRIYVKTFLFLKFRDLIAKF